MKVTKTQKIINWFVKHPSSDVKVVAKKFDATNKAFERDFVAKEFVK